MALRLNELVICGEFDNSRPYAVHGWLKLRGQQRPLIFNLTGNPAPDLLGKHFRFEVPERMHELEFDDPGSVSGELEAAVSNSDQAPDFDETPAAGLPRIAWQQIGPTGAMTAARRVKQLKCTPEEFEQHDRRNEPAPFEWKPSLYLEWFSQNGRVVLELVAPEIEFLDDADDDEDDDDDLFDIEHHHPDMPFVDPDSIDSLLNDEGDGFEWGEGPSGDDDPFELFSPELHELFEQNSFDTDRAILGSEAEHDSSGSLEELELFDHLLESGEGDPIGLLFDEPMRFPRPEALSDEEVETALKSLLGQLALFGIALDICEHFTPRDAYTLLLDEICREEHAYPELRNTQWVQHFMTSEYCEQCEAEFDEFESEFTSDEDDLDDDLGRGSPDDDPPF